MPVIKLIERLDAVAQNFYSFVPVKLEFWLINKKNIDGTFAENADKRLRRDDAMELALLGVADRAASDLISNTWETTSQDGFTGRMGQFCLNPACALTSPSDGMYE